MTCILQVSSKLIFAYFPKLQCKNNNNAQKIEIVMLMWNKHK
jgi:hypothetical protein